MKPKYYTSSMFLPVTTRVTVNVFQPVASPDSTSVIFVSESTVIVYLKSIKRQKNIILLLTPNKTYFKSIYKIR